MKNLKRMLCLLICLITCAALVVPAMAVGMTWTMVSDLKVEGTSVERSVKVYNTDASGKLTEGGTAPSYNLVADDTEITIANGDAETNLVILVDGYAEENGKYVLQYGTCAMTSDLKIVQFQNDFSEIAAVKGIGGFSFPASTLKNGGAAELIKIQFLQIGASEADTGVWSVWLMIDNEAVAKINAAGKVEEDPGNPFTDVPKDSYYHDAVVWALENNVTKGMTATTFGPKETCTRGQVATFLWRALGSPEPETTKNPFKDIKESDYYYKPILWAYENGITNGTSKTEFSPNGTCTSAHVVTFLWRANGKPAATAEGTEYYAEAVAWANEKGLLEGVGSTFKPENNSPRADIVTYLYRNAEGK